MYVHNLIALSEVLYTFISMLYCVCLYPQIYKFQEAAVVVWEANRFTMVHFINVMVLWMLAHNMIPCDQILQKEWTTEWIKSLQTK